MAALPIRLRKLVIFHIKRGLSYRAIADILQISIGVISKLVKQYRQHNNLRDNLKNCGRKQILNVREVRRVLLFVRRNPCITCYELKNIIESEFGKQLSVKTVRNILKRNGFVSKFKKVKPLLTKRHKRLRLNFARQYVNKDMSFWRTVMFTDETRITLQNDSKRQRVWRKANEKKQFHAYSVKHPAGVMLWGAFTASGPGRIRFLNTGERCNSEWYLKVLNTQVRLTALTAFGNSNWTLQDDGAPCHRSRIVKNFIVRNNWETLDWPPQSPDLNPIENAWSILKFHVKKHNNGNVIQLKRNILRTWHHKLTNEYFENLALSMQKRLQLCIKLHGGSTDY